MAFKNSRTGRQPTALQSANNGLLQWCKKTTEGYKGVSIKNFHTSWRDGLAFCALVHRHKPDAFDFNTLVAENMLENNKLAFTLAEKYFSIPQLLDAEDMLMEKPEPFSVMTYLGAFYKSCTPEALSARGLLTVEQREMDAKLLQQQQQQAQLQQQLQQSLQSQQSQEPQTQQTSKSPEKSSDLIKSVSYTRRQSRLSRNSLYQQQLQQQQQQQQQQQKQDDEQKEKQDALPPTEENHDKQVPSGGSVMDSEGDAPRSRITPKLMRVLSKPFGRRGSIREPFDGAPTSPRRLMLSSGSESKAGGGTPQNSSPAPVTTAASENRPSKEATNVSSTARSSSSATPNVPTVSAQQPVVPTVNRRPPVVPASQLLRQQGKPAPAPTPTSAPTPTPAPAPSPSPQIPTITAPKGSTNHSPVSTPRVDEPEKSGQKSERASVDRSGIAGGTASKVGFWEKKQKELNQPPKILDGQRQQTPVSSTQTTKVEPPVSSGTSVQPVPTVNSPVSAPTSKPKDTTPEPSHPPQLANSFPTETISLEVPKQEEPIKLSPSPSSTDTADSPLVVVIPLNDTPVVEIPVLESPIEVKLNLDEVISISLDSCKEKSENQLPEHVPVATEQLISVTVSIPNTVVPSIPKVELPLVVSSKSESSGANTTTTVTSVSITDNLVDNIPKIDITSDLSKTEEDDFDKDDEELAIVLALQNLVSAYENTDGTLLTPLIESVKNTHKIFDQYGRRGVYIAPEYEQEALMETFDVLKEVISDFCQGIAENLPFEQMKEEAEEIEDLIREILDFLLAVEDGEEEEEELDFIDAFLREEEPSSTSIDVGSEGDFKNVRKSEDKFILTLEKKLEAAEESITRLTRQNDVYSESAQMLKDRLTEMKSKDENQRQQINQLSLQNNNNLEKIKQLDTIISNYETEGKNVLDRLEWSEETLRKKNEELRKLLEENKKYKDNEVEQANQVTELNSQIKGYEKKINAIVELISKTKNKSALKPVEQGHEEKKDNEHEVPKSNLDSSKLLSDLESETEVYIETINRLEKRVAELEQETKQHQLQSSQSQSQQDLQVQIADLNAKLVNYEKNHNTLENQFNQQLSEETKKHQIIINQLEATHAKEKENMELLIKNLKTELESKEKENTSLRSRMAEISQHVVQFTQTISKLSAPSPSSSLLLLDTVPISEVFNKVMHNLKIPNSHELISRWSTTVGKYCQTAANLQSLIQSKGWLQLEFEDNKEGGGNVMIKAEMESVMLRMSEL